MRSLALLGLTLLATISAAQEFLKDESIVGDTFERGLTPHFSNWLNQNGYGKYKFERTDLQGGSYGGKKSDDDKLNHYPIVMFHGNSDIAVGLVGQFTGFTKPIQHFLSQGYTKGELYITTWGPGNQLKAQEQTHSQEYLQYLRAFTEAVLAYTGAEKINVIGHSMGVTLGRRVIKGGQVNGSPTPFNLGPTLNGKVDTFIGIAGANYGLMNCYFISIVSTCNGVNGFYPGDAMGAKPISTYLGELNKDTTREGANVFSIYSTNDDLIGYGDMVYGQLTSLWPTVDKSKSFSFLYSGHMRLRDETVTEQYSLITNKRFLSSTAQDSVVEDVVAPI